MVAGRRFEPFNRTGFRSRALFAGRPAKGILYGNFNHISVRSFIPTGAPTEPEDKKLAALATVPRSSPMFRLAGPRAGRPAAHVDTDGEVDCREDAVQHALVARNKRGASPTSPPRDRP